MQNDVREVVLLLEEVHVVFVNNFKFDEELWQDILVILAGMRCLRHVICVRPICSKHDRVCEIRYGKLAPCVVFEMILDSPVNVSWDGKPGRIYVYRRNRV